MTPLCLYCAEGVCEPSLREKIGRLILVGFRGTHIEENHPIARQIKEGKIGGVILFGYDWETGTLGRNITSSEQLKALTASLQGFSPAPLLIALDQEGGAVNRLSPALGFPVTLSAKKLGRLDDVATTLQESVRIADLLIEHGINWNFAPVVDVDINPDSPAIGRKERSFSADPDIVYRHAKAFVQGHRQAGVLTALKHFPGHGSAMEDSHLGFVDVTQTWSENELIPYIRLIQSNDADSIMLSHVWHERLDSKFPASLSEKIVKDLLRKRLNFQGVVVTDDLQMRAVSAHYSLRESVKRSLLAGADMLMFANQMVYQEQVAEEANQLILEMIDSGEIPLQRILEAYSRVESFRIFF